MFWNLTVSTGISCTKRPAGVEGSLKKDLTEAGSKGQRLLTSDAHTNRSDTFSPPPAPTEHLHVKCHTHPCKGNGLHQRKQQMYNSTRQNDHRKTVGSGCTIYCLIIFLGKLINHAFLLSLLT